jgi:hypothetical protein
MNYHSVAFSVLPGVPNCCGQFDEGSGWDYAAGALIEKYITEDITISLALSFDRIGGRLAETERTWISADDQLEPAEINHTIDTYITSLSLTPAVNYNPFRDFWISGGIFAGWPAEAQFKQKETLIKPATWGTFENGSRIRNLREGSIEDISPLLFAFAFSAMYELPLNRKETSFITPHLTASLPISSALKSESWNIFRIQAGVYIKFSTYDKDDTPLRPH